MNQTATPTAAETYAARRNDIARLMDVLQMELDKHAEAANADPRNWGRAGDLGKVRSDLIDLVGFMSGWTASTSRPSERRRVSHQPGEREMNPSTKISIELAKALAKRGFHIPAIEIRTPTAEPGAS